MAQRVGYTAPAKGTDGSDYEERYPLTSLGQPVGLAEYAYRVAKGSSTHAIQILEWNPFQNGQIKQYHLDADENFRELELSTRDGQRRFSYET